MTTDALVERTNYPPLHRKVTLFVRIIRHGIAFAFEPQLPHRRRMVPRKKEIAVLLTDDGTQINSPQKASAQWAPGWVHPLVRDRA